MASNVVVARQPGAASGPNADRRVMPLTIPAGTRSLGPAPPPEVITLERQLQVNQQRYRELDAYYRGVHSHSFDSLRFQQAFGRQLARFADNWMRLVISATANRLAVQGFRIGAGDEDGLSEIDGRAWQVWKANRLGQASTIAHRDAMKFGESFVMVDPTGPMPAITVESPYQVVGQRDSQNRYRLINAIKKWIGDDGFQYLNFYLPEVVMKFRAAGKSESPVPNDPERIMQQPSWVQIDEVDNPLGVVPVVALENQPDLITGGLSDLEDLIPLNDGLNKVLRDMLVASEYQGFRQRWATGVDVPKDPETGKPLTDRLAQLKAAHSNVWMFADENAKVGEFGQIDLTSYVNAIDLFVHHIAQVSSTPAYMLIGARLVNISADAIRASELGFVGKLVTKQSDFGVAWEQAMGMALGGAEMATPDAPIEVVWKDAAANSGSVLANELAIMGKLGVPQTALLEKYGFSPTTVARWKAQGLLGAPDAEAASQISIGPADKGAAADAGAPSDSGL